MKKLITIFLLLTYGLSSTGATVYLHYCCGKLDTVSFSSAYKKACPTKAVFTKGCCDNKHLELKVKSDQEPAAKWISATKVLKGIIYTPVFQVVVPAQDTPVNKYATGPPKARSFVPLFKKHCTYLI